MAETSSAAFDCATKGWNGSQQTASTLSDLISELKTANNKASLAKQQKNQVIKNGNGVDEFVLNNLATRPSLSPSDQVNSLSTSKPFLPQVQQAPSTDQQFNNLSTKQLDEQLATDNQSKESKELTDSTNPTYKLQRPERKDNIVFRVGFKLEACDSTGTWYPAKGSFVFGLVYFFFQI